MEQPGETGPSSPGAAAADSGEGGGLESGQDQPERLALAMPSGVAHGSHAKRGLVQRDNAIPSVFKPFTRKGVFAWLAGIVTFALVFGGGVRLSRTPGIVRMIRGGKH